MNKLSALELDEGKSGSAVEAKAAGADRVYLSLEEYKAATAAGIYDVI